MTNMEQISTLKKEATADTVFNDVLHVFAMRERARKDVTIQALAVNMKKAGYDYSTNQLGAALEKLARMGFGRIEKDLRGRIKALRDIKVTLQSLGTVAAQGGPGADVKSFKPRNKFGKLAHAPESIKIPPQANQPERLLKNAVIITMMVNDKAVNIQVPKDLTATELAHLVTKLQK